MRKVVLLLFFCSVFAGTSFAYGPYGIWPLNTGGKAYHWDKKKIGVKYDSGDFSEKIKGTKQCSISNSTDPCSSQIKDCGILPCIRSQLQRWADAHMLTKDGQVVKTVDLAFDDLGTTDKDITNDNYDEYVEKAAKGGYILVVFDEDESILSDPDRNAAGNLGITYLKPDPFNDNSSVEHITSAIVIFNGSCLDGNTSTGCGNNDYYNDGLSRFAGVVSLHEFGHALGLDHSVPLLETLGSTPSSEPAKPSAIPTMYSIVISDDQADLNIDDVVGISSLFPNLTNFEKKFCTVTGSIRNGDTKKPIQGMNVVAYSKEASEDEKYMDSRSNVSGSLYWPKLDKSYVGNYTIRGLKDGVEYNIVVEGVPYEVRRRGGGVNPFFPSDEDDWPEAPLPGELTDVSNVITKGNSDTVKCEIKTSGTAEEIAASRNIVMDTKDIIPGECDENVDDCGGGGGGGEGDGKKGWCMSLGGPVNPGLWLFWPVLAGVFIISRKVRFSRK